MKTLYLIENAKINEIKAIANEKDAHVVVFDYKSHLLLKNYKIEHQTSDDFFSDDERKSICKFCLSLTDWYSVFDEPDVKFHDVNLLSIIDRNEILENLMIIVPKIHVATKSIEKIQPEKIFSSKAIYDLLANFNKEIRPINDLDDNDKHSVTYDKIDVSYGIGNFNLGIQIDRNRYQSIKNYLEKIVCNTFNLRKKNENKKKVILVEFNPENFSDLLEEMNRQEIQPILINFRRSAIWSKNSILNLRKTHSIVGIPDDFIDKKTLLEIDHIHRSCLKKIHDMFMKEQKLSSVFILNGIRFEQHMKKTFLRILEDRIKEYLIGICLAESINKLDNVIGIITLNVSGETEKIFSLTNQKAPVILLQHAFANYTQAISYLDALDDFHLIKDKIAVWGEQVKQYLIDIRKVSKDKIIVCGSPKYDSYVSVKKEKREQVILITPRPIINHVEGIRISSYEKYEKTIDSILELTKIKNMKIIFKLHPQQNEHNTMLREYIKKKNPNVAILQNKPISDLLIQCDLHVNIAPDNFDATSVLLESMIIGRPSINIQLQKSEIEFEFMRNGAVKTVSYDSDITKEISLLLDERESVEILANAQKYLPHYLSNQGKASRSLVNSLASTQQNKQT